MKKIFAISGSNSKNSINKKFAGYIADKIGNAEVTLADWDNLVLPLYSPDLEGESGIPEIAMNFKKMIDNSDAIVLSLAEHNGSYTAAFKNLWDWTSRIDMKFWSNKPMFLAATSPGGRGGATVLNSAKSSLPHFGGNIICEFSLPQFYENFKVNDIANEDLNQSLNEQISIFRKAL